MTNDLLTFLLGSPEKLNILLIDSTRYLPELVRRYPESDFTVITPYKDVPQLVEFRDFKVNWQIADYRLKKPIIDEASLDIVIAENALEFAYEPYEELMTISRYLTDVGKFYFSFPNIRYNKIIKAISAGHFPFRSEHLWAKEEIVKLLNDTLFKEIHFRAGEQLEDDVSDLEEMGFANYNNDLLTKTWLVEAAKSTASIANLKSLYDKSTREKLSRVLHRIEYDIDRAENLAALKTLCKENFIFPEYVHDFIDEACVHKEIVHSLTAKILN